MEIKDSHILITEANQGIGRAVALMCAEDKAHLHLVVQKNEAGLEDEMIKAGAASVKIHEAELSEPSQVQQLLKSLSKTRIDILFNNATQLVGGPLDKQSIQDIDQMLQVNVNALIHLTRCVLPSMLKNKRGKIINHSSVSAMMNFPHASTYAATKAAILAFTNSLQNELKGSGVSTLVLLTPGGEASMLKEIPKFYGLNLDLGFLKPIPPKKYAQMIREAILEDLTELKPSGITGAGLLMAQHLPKVFDNVILKRLKKT